MMSDIAKWFDVFWNTSFLPEVNAQLFQCQDLSLQDAAKLRLRPDAREMVYAQFVQIYKMIHDHMKKVEEVRIDRHKIGATMAVAILKTTPMILEAGEEESISLRCRLANEILAFGAALNILISFLNARARQDHDNTMLAFLNNGPKFPPCNKHGYEMHIYRSFHYAMRSDHLDVFLLAHILFWIEHNTLFCPDANF